MIQTFHTFVVKAGPAAVAQRAILGLRDNTTTAIEVVSDTIWLLQADTSR